MPVGRHIIGGEIFGDLPGALAPTPPPTPPPLLQQFTVFAPTNAAFDKYLKANSLTAEQLLASPDLKGILKQHIVKNVTAKAASLTNGQAIPTSVGPLTVDLATPGKVAIKAAGRQEGAGWLEGRTGGWVGRRPGRAGRAERGPNPPNHSTPCPHSQHRRRDHGRRPRGQIGHPHHRCVRDRVLRGWLCEAGRGGQAGRQRSSRPACVRLAGPTFGLPGPWAGRAAGLA